MNSEEIRADFIERLKKENIRDVHNLWARAKEHAQRWGYTMGGSYATWSDTISVSLIDNGLPEMVRFRIALKEVQPS